ncbi:MAG TPA: general stress protein [Bacilli bacterium]
MEQKFTRVHVVNDIGEASAKIGQLEQDGYAKEEIFVLTHDRKRTEYISKHTHGQMVGIAEEGVINAVANLFRSTGEGLRAKLRAMGISAGYAEQLEREMDMGKIVILAWSGTIYDEDNHDPDITYFPPSSTYVPLT